MENPTLPWQKPSKMVASVLKLIRFHKNQFFIQNVNFPVFNLEWNFWTSLPNEKSSWNYVIIDCICIYWCNSSFFWEFRKLDIESNNNLFDIMRELLQKGKSPPLLIALNVWLVDSIWDFSIRLAIQLLKAQTFCWSQIDYEISSCFKGQ